VQPYHECPTKTRGDSLPVAFSAVKLQIPQEPVRTEFQNVIDRGSSTLQTNLPISVSCVSMAPGKLQIVPEIRPVSHLCLDFPGIVIIFALIFAGGHDFGLVRTLARQ
jgi:hypothetical protein